MKYIETLSYEDRVNFYCIQTKIDIIKNQLENLQSFYTLAKNCENADEFGDNMLQVLNTSREIANQSGI